MTNEERLKKLEYEYRILSENALEVIWVFDISTRKFTYVSPSVRKLRGLPVEEAVQESLEDAVPKETFQAGMENTRRMVELYRNGERRPELLTAVQDMEIFYRDQTIKQIEVTVRLIENPETGALEVLGVTRDITERKKLEAQLQQAVETKNTMIEHMEKSEKALKRLTVELHQKNLELQEIAAKDTLTGIFNRYAFDCKAAEESERCQRYGYPLSVILFDLDSFKIVNDAWGHDVGDSVLVRVAEAAKSTVRKQDTLARWGGEEFVVLMPHTDLASAVKAAEKLRDTFATLRHPDINATVTASFGATEFIRSETKESWFRRVDYAMFCSKNKGGNSVTGIDWMEASPFVKVSLAWKPAWESGNPVIDSQHRQIVALANQTMDAMLGMESAALNEAMRDLNEHIQLHFREEETLLQEIGYPQAEVHASVHQALQARVAGYCDQFAARRLPSAAFISFLLNDVVIGHIQGDDIRYFPWLKAHSQAI
jgi:diguanylate cyclase (GGDEF)-like protein/hemerythrin-like metal-binding protein/PAS domain S-box-containing protein